MREIRSDNASETDMADLQGRPGRNPASPSCPTEMISSREVSVVQNRVQNLSRSVGPGLDKENAEFFRDR